jgi:hypothetical protein
VIARGGMYQQKRDMRLRERCNRVHATDGARVVDGATRGVAMLN